MLYNYPNQVSQFLTPLRKDRLTKLLTSLGIIACGLCTGYLIQRLVESQHLRLPCSLEYLRKALQKSALLFVLPVTIAGAIWVAQVQSAAIAALPLLGFGAIMLGGLCALAAARLMALPPYKAGALYGCGSFTNIGSIGALICYIYLGEAGFALVPIYKIFEELTYYSIGFPIAKYHSATVSAGQEPTAARIKKLLTDPFILATVSSLVVGALLNLAAIPRPALFRTINAVFIPLGTGMLLISIGLSMRFRRVRNYVKECVAVSIIKFMVVPVAISTVAYLIGYATIENGLPLKVVIILTSMPVAFNALIPPSIYDLDLDLANACWFFTTACLIAVLPILLLIVRATG
jgi:predicted permease